MTIQKSYRELLTRFTVFANKSLLTGTNVGVHSVSAGSSILTRVWRTIINICFKWNEKKNSNGFKAVKERCNRILTYCSLNPRILEGGGVKLTPSIFLALHFCCWIIVKNFRATVCCSLPHLLKLVTQLQRLKIQIKIERFHTISVKCFIGTTMYYCVWTDRFHSCCHWTLSHTNSCENSPHRCKFPDSDRDLVSSHLCLLSW